MTDLDKIKRLIDDINDLMYKLHDLEDIAIAHYWVGADKEIRAEARQAMRALAGFKETTLYDMRNQLKAEEEYGKYHEDDCDD